MKLRPYQIKTVADVEAAWTEHRRVLVVLPTGGGKSLIAAELLNIDGPCLFVAHRRELVQQMADRLRARFGWDQVGVIMPGEAEQAEARIQVATVQTLLARGTLPPADRIVLDEAHHYVAAEWSELVASYGDSTRVLGLTATPQRGDGQPLGDAFDSLIVSAHYSELLADKYLVPARVVNATQITGKDLACEPLDAWQKWAEGSQTFGFFPRVAIAQEQAAKFREAGISAEVIHAKTKHKVRAATIERFRKGELKCLFCVDTLTEGIDIPEARAIILGRKFGSVGGYLQAAGRVLRTADNKPDAIVIDLTGASLRFESPTRDRVYSLGGTAISTAEKLAEDAVAEAERLAVFEQKTLELKLQVAREAVWKDLPHMEHFMAAATRLGIDLLEWPLFEHHAVLPHGEISPWDQQPHVSTRWTKESLSKPGTRWMDGILDWFDSNDVEGNLQGMRQNVLPRITTEARQKGAQPMITWLWDHRENLEQVLAIFTLAWMQTCRSFYFIQPGPARRSIAPLDHWANELVSAERPAADPFWVSLPSWSTSETAFDLRSQSMVYEGILQAALVSQTKYRLVRLTKDPDFDVRLFLLDMDKRAALHARTRTAREAQGGPSCC